MKNPFNFSTILGFGMFLLTVGYYIFAKPDNLSTDASFFSRHNLLVFLNNY